MQKAFSLSRCCAFALRVGKKRSLCKKTLKNKNGLFRMQKAFSLSEAVLLHCEWAKNVPCAKETAKK